MGTVLTLAARATLDEAVALLDSHDPRNIPAAIRLLRDWTRSLRESLTDEEWKEVVAQDLRTHPVFSILLEDPFIERSVRKPRGYAGDAVMLDYVYHHPANDLRLANTTARGRAICDFTTNAPGSAAVRNRVLMLAAEIDALCSLREKPAILSIACGHMREAVHSTAIAQRGFGRFLALDQDCRSLDVVQDDLCEYGVEARPGTVKDVIARGRHLGQFDFIYAAGLYDYLPEPVASRLLRAMVALLKPEGKVWVANFLEGIPDRGYLEAFGDWWLIYRTEQQMLDLAAPLPRDSYSSLRTFTEPENNVVFLEVCR